jgi:REP-associated tyrosine transposase
MSHTSGNILLHFIFSTAQRRPLIEPEFRDDLFAYLGGIVRGCTGRRSPSTANPITSTC